MRDTPGPEVPAYVLSRRNCQSASPCDFLQPIYCLFSSRVVTHKCEECKILRVAGMKARTHDKQCAGKLSWLYKFLGLMSSQDSQKQR